MDEFSYRKKIVNRSLCRYVFGYAIRFLFNLKYAYIRSVARKNGAKIGKAVVMPLTLAKKLNSNCLIGNHVSIQTDKIDVRSPITIGNYVIIGGGK